jgi:lipopolysaccharide heptosyltransferase I
MSENGSPRILIVRRSSLGDVIVGLPALVALRRGFPQAHIAWLVEEHLADLLRGHECLDDIITIRRFSGREPLQWWRETREVGRRLRERRFDLAVDLQGLGKSALMCYLSGARRRVGFAGETRGVLGLPWIRERVPMEPGTAAVPRSLAMADYLGAPIYPVEFRYPLLPEARAWAEDLVPAAGQPLVALVLGASTAVKAWPAEHFVTLIERLRGAGAEVVLIGAEAEREREAAVQAGLATPALSAVGQTDLPRLAALLARADAVVAGDTGALHVAAAVGTPVVGLYGPTSPELTGPYGEQHRVLWDQPTCGPCGRRPRCRDYHCMSDLTPGRVAEAVREVLDARTYPAGADAGTPPLAGRG